MIMYTIDYHHIIHVCFIRASFNIILEDITVCDISNRFMMIILFLYPRQFSPILLFEIGFSQSMLLFLNDSITNSNDW